MAKSADRRGGAVRDELRKRLAFAIVWPPALCLVVCCALVGMFCQRLGSEAMALGAELPSLMPLLLTTACYVAVATGVLMLSARRFSTYVAGPLGRMQSFVRGLGEPGAERALSVRKGDMLEGLADDLNRLAERIEELRGASRRDAAELPADTSARPSETADDCR